MNVFKYLVTCSPAKCYKIAGRLHTVKNEHLRLDGINVHFLSFTHCWSLIIHPVVPIYYFNT